MHAPNSAMAPTQTSGNVAVPAPSTCPPPLPLPSRAWLVPTPLCRALPPPPTHTHPLPLPARCAPQQPHGVPMPLAEPCILKCKPRPSPAALLPPAVRISGPAGPSGPPLPPQAGPPPDRVPSQAGVVVVQRRRRRAQPVRVCPCTWTRVEDAAAAAAAAAAGQQHGHGHLGLERQPHAQHALILSLLRLHQGRTRHSTCASHAALRGMCPHLEHFGPHVRLLGGVPEQAAAACAVAVAARPKGRVPERA